MRARILGCGASTGVPAIGNRWGACDPANPKNRRLRPSVLVEVGEVGVLIDTTPDLRQQLLDADVRRLDAVVWSHVHADHSHGLDDLREICRLIQGPLPAYALPEHLDALKTRFPYAFQPLPEGHAIYRPVLDERPIDGPFAVAGVTITPFKQDHGYVTSLGFRIGGFAYSTDVIRLDEAAFQALEGVEVWVVDCQQRVEAAYPVHAHLDLALSWIARVRPRRAYLTHMSTTMDYDSLRQILPPGVEPAYDGLTIEIG